MLPEMKTQMYLQRNIFFMETIFKMFFYQNYIYILTYIYCLEIYQIWICYWLTDKSMHWRTKYEYYCCQQHQERGKYKNKSNCPTIKKVNDVKYLSNNCLLITVMH